MRSTILTALASVFLTSLTGFGMQTAYAQSDTSDQITIDAITSAVKDLCLHPEKQGEYITIEGNVDAGVLVRLVGANIAGTVKTERWTGFGNALQNATPRTHVECTQNVLPILLDAFDVVHFGCRSIRTVGFGGFGGGQFDSIEPRTLQLRSGDYVDAIVLNGVRHGGQGGQLSGSLQLEPGEFITSVVVRSGVYVDRLVFTTNHGRALIGGGGGGARSTLDNIRVLKIGGRSGVYLDRIELTYCELH